MTSPELPDTTKDKIASPWVMAYANCQTARRPEMEPHPDPSGRYIAYARKCRRAIPSGAATISKAPPRWCCSIPRPVPRKCWSIPSRAMSRVPTLIYVDTQNARSRLDP